MPSDLSDRTESSIIQEPEEAIDQYGVWVKSGPEDIPQPEEDVLDLGLSNLDETIANPETEGAESEALPTEAEFAETEDDLSFSENAVEPDSLPELSAESGLEDASSIDDLSDIEIHFPQEEPVEGADQGDWTTETESAAGAETTADADELAEVNATEPVETDLRKEDAMSTERKDMGDETLDNLDMDITADLTDFPTENAQENVEEDHFQEISLDDFVDAEAENQAKRSGSSSSSHAGEEEAEETLEDDFPDLDLDFDEEIEGESSSGGFSAESLEDDFGIPMEEISSLDDITEPSKPIATGNVVEINTGESAKEEDELEPLDELEMATEELDMTEAEEALPVGQDEATDFSELESLESVDLDEGAPHQDESVTEQSGFDEALPEMEEAEVAESPESEAGEFELELTETAVEDEEFPDLKAVEPEASPVRQVPAEREDSSTALLRKIESELLAIKNELADLKKELVAAKRGGAPAAAAGPRTEDESGFFDEEEDETIALTGDELDNILSTADIKEASGDTATIPAAAVGTTGTSEEGGAAEEDLIPLDWSETEAEAPVETTTDSDQGQMDLSDIDADQMILDTQPGIPELELETLPEGEAQTETDFLKDTDLELTFEETEETEKPNEFEMRDASEMEIPVYGEDLGESGVEEMEELTVEIPSGETSESASAAGLEDVEIEYEGEHGDMAEEMEMLGSAREFHEEALESPDEFAADELVIEAEDLEPLESNAETENADLEFGVAELQGFPEESAAPDEQEETEIIDLSLAEGREAEDLDIPDISIELEEETPVEDSETVRAATPKTAAPKAQAPRTAPVQPTASVRVQPVQPAAARPAAQPARTATASKEEIPAGLREEVRDVLSYMDQLLESLPEDKIHEFAQSKHFQVYKKLFEELGLAP